MGASQGEGSAQHTEVADLNVEEPRQSIHRSAAPLYIFSLAGQPVRALWYLFCSFHGRCSKQYDISMIRMIDTYLFAVLNLYY